MWTIIYNAYGDWKKGESTTSKKDAVLILQSVMGVDYSPRKETKGFYMIGDHAVVSTSRLNSNGYA